MRARSGMTLIELTVGIVIAALAVAAGYAAFASIVDHRDRVRSMVNATAGTASVRRTLADWIENSQVQISSGSAPATQMSLNFGSEPQDLRFITTALTPLNTDSTTVDLFVNTNMSDPRHGLDALLTDSNGIDSMVVQLDSTVTGMSVMYLTDQTVGRQWIDPSQVSQPAPIAVQLILTSQRLASEPSLLQMPLILPLRSVS